MLAHGLPGERYEFAGAGNPTAQGGTVADDGVNGPGWGSTGAALDELERPVTILVGPSGSGKMDETTPEMARAGVRTARELEAATGIPVRFCTMLGELTAAFGGPHGVVDRARILAIERHIVPPFGQKPSGSARRSAVV